MGGIGVKIAQYVVTASSAAAGAAVGAVVVVIVVPAAFEAGRITIAVAKMVKGLWSKSGGSSPPDSSSPEEKE